MCQNCIITKTTKPRVTEDTVLRLYNQFICEWKCQDATQEKCCIFHFVTPQAEHFMTIKTSFKKSVNKMQFMFNSKSNFTFICDPFYNIRSF